MKALIFAGGHVKDYTSLKVYVKDVDFIICADSGTHHALKMGIKPDLIIGDLDSINSEALAKVKEMGITVDKYPPEKDYTDTDLALRIAYEKGASEAILIGGIGSRPDHSLANILLTVQFNNMGLKVKLVGENWEIFLIDKKAEILGKKGDLLSLIPISPQVTGVTTYGLYYSLQKDTLYLGQALGISNIFIKEKAVISIESGLLLAIKYK